jgi:hypothetical protein
VIVAECDPDGGDIAAWYGLALAPGLVSLAAQARQGLSPSTISTHLQRLPGDDGGGGAGLVVAPPGAEQAIAAVRALAGAGAGERLAALDDTDVLVDIGRLRPDTPAMALIAHAAATLLVLRGDVSQVAHARGRVAALAPSTRLALVVVGDRPYTGEQISAAVGAPVAGVVADDVRGARTLTGAGGGARMLRRSPLLRSAAAVAERMRRSAERPARWTVQSAQAREARR